MFSLGSNPNLGLPSDRFGTRRGQYWTACQALPCPTGCPKQMPAQGVMSTEYCPSSQSAMKAFHLDKSRVGKCKGNKGCSWEEAAGGHSQRALSLLIGRSRGMIKSLMFRGRITKAETCLAVRWPWVRSFHRSWKHVFLCRG